MLSATTTLNLNLLPNAMDQGYVYFLINEIIKVLQVLQVYKF